MRIITKYYFNYFHLFVSPLKFLILHQFYQNHLTTCYEQPLWSECIKPVIQRLTHSYLIYDGAGANVDCDWPIVEEDQEVKLSKNNFVFFILREMIDTGSCVVIENWKCVNHLQGVSGIQINIILRSMVFTYISKFIVRCQECWIYTGCPRKIHSHLGKGQTTPKWTL